MSNSGDENNTANVESDEDPYAVVSEAAADDDEFVKVMESEDGDSFVELPKEDDGTIMLSTLQGQFPNAAGLKYKSSSGGWRGVRITDGALKAPQSGWGDTKYYVNINKTASIKTNSTSEEKETEKSDESSDDNELLKDLFVIQLPSEAKDEDLKEYFTTNCGEMDLCEVKFDRRTGRAKGFGFIRFKTADAAKEALNGEHTIMGQKIIVKLSKKRTTPCQLFVGRLPEGTTKEELNEYFSQYGELTEAYITSPFRGFGFVTFECTNVAYSILRKTHEINGTQLNVAVAKPKRDDMRERGRSRYDDDYQREDSRRRDHYDEPRRDRSRHDRRDDSRHSRYDSPPRAQSSVNDMKRMLYDMLSQRR